MNGDLDGERERGPEDGLNIEAEVQKDESFFLFINEIDKLFVV